MYTAMIVDDEPLTREYFKKNITLINPNWKIVAEASDGEEALKSLSKKKIDLLITDIKMPVLDGLELCRIILKNNPKQKIIILSGYEEFDFAKEAIELGVSSYILKPIVKVELKKNLDKITQKIKAEEENRLELDRLISISKDLKKQVIEKFLKAIISDSYLEIKSLYPILFKMKESLIDSESIIMILRADEDVIIENNIPVSDISLIKLLLKETASKIVEDKGIGRVFSDKEDNTILLLNIPDKNSYVKYSKNLFDIISKEFTKRTKIKISGSIGNLENEVLQLNLSYNNAYNTILERLISGKNKLYIYDEKTSISDRTHNFSRIISSIKSGVLDNNEVSYMTAISKYIEQMSTHSTSEIIRFGVHLIKSLKELTDYVFNEKIEKALKILKNLPHQDHHVFSKDEILKIFKELVNILKKNQIKIVDKPEEIDYIAEAKNYIYIHYSEPISLALVAEKVCVSPSYLSSVFHEKVGESYIKFLTRVRMEQAARLLKTKPELKIYRVSEKVGYISVKHFSYIFKNYFGQTPGEYQEKHKNL